MPLRPNFFIVGAPRSGTTSIWTYLSRHPNVYMSYQKEPMYFGSDLTKSPNEFFVLETNAYLEMFQRGADKTIRGEASVMYLFSKKAAQEIQAFNPNARILIMLRNPVEMIYSFHGQLRWGGYENIADFDEALAAEADRRRGLRIPKSALVPEVLYYSEVAEFAPQVERYLRVFPRDQIKIILFDDFARSPAEVYFSLLDFLGVEGIAPRSYAIRNPHKEPRSIALAALLQRPPKFITKLLDLIPQPHRYAMMGLIQGLLNTRRVDRPPLRPKTRQRLMEQFAPDIRKLELLIDRDLSKWLGESGDASKPVLEMPRQKA